MASTKQMQQRAKEKNATPKAAAMVTVLAFRHGRHNVEEMIMVQVGAVPNSNISQDNLLGSLATMKWGGRFDKVAGLLAHYIPMTKSWQGRKQFGIALDTNSLVIHFHEDDPDSPGKHSCRMSAWGPNETIKGMAEQWVVANKETHDINKY